MARRHRNNDLEDAPKVKLTRETFRQAVGIFSFVKPYRWYLISGLFLLTISSLVFLAFGTLFSQLIKVAQGEDFYGLTLNEMGLGMVVVLVLQGVISYFRVTLFANASERGTADLRKSVYDKIISLPITFFEQNKTGELVSRITSDVDRLYSIFSITLAEFVRQIIILVGSIVILVYTNGKLTLIVLSTFPVIVVLAMVFGRYIRKLSKERQKILAESNSILSESVQTISAVKSFTNEVFETMRYGVMNQSVVSLSLKYAKGRGAFSSFIVTILFGSLSYVIWQAAVMVRSGSIDAGDLFGFVFFAGIIGGAIASLGNFYAEILGAIGATERLREILQMESEVDLKEIGKSPVMTLKGNIEYKNVFFSYPTRKDIPVLKGIDLKIKAGESVALVGTSGAGKSTIVQLLQRFYELESGEIFVDGKNINDFNISQYRSHFALVPQEVLLFGGTIRENILYGKPDATDEEVIEAAKQSNSWSFIKSFPEGLETKVGERGVKLSGGQRQRIAIARAILRDPAILILDEATSSLDAESEKEVQDALEKLMEGRTSIIIAHRLATIRAVDCIYVIDNGKIIEQGTHNELSLLENGAYSSLAKLQFELTS